MLNFPVMSAYLIGESRFFGASWLFRLLRLISTLIYLFTDEFLVDKYLRQLYKRAN